MATYRFEMGQAFPAGDPVARWLVTLSIGFNDIVFTSRKFEEDLESHEMSEYFRLGCLRLWEVARFLKETYDGWPEVKAFVDALPDPAPECFTRLRGLSTEGELNYIGTELAQIRDLVAHYQEMDPQAAGKPRDAITRSLQEIAGEEVTLDVPERVGDLRMGHADAIIARTMLRLMPEEQDKKRVMEAIAQGNGDVIVFGQLALGKWLRELPDGVIRTVDPPSSGNAASGCKTP